MKKMLIALSLAIVVPTFALETNCDKYKNSYDRTYCLSKLFVESDKELNDVYKELREKLHKFICKFFDDCKTKLSKKFKEELGPELTKIFDIHNTIPPCANATAACATILRLASRAGNSGPASSRHLKIQGKQDTIAIIYRICQRQYLYGQRLYFCPAVL